MILHSLPYGVARGGLTVNQSQVRWFIGFLSNFSLLYHSLLASAYFIPFPPSWINTLSPFQLQFFLRNKILNLWCVVVSLHSLSQKEQGLRSTLKIWKAAVPYCWIEFAVFTCIKWSLIQRSLMSVERFPLIYEDCGWGLWIRVVIMTSHLLW